MNIGEFTIYLCNILCIIPPITCRQSNSIRKIHNYWTAFTTIVVIVSFGLSTYRRIVEVYNFMDPTISLLDQLSQTSFTLTNLLTSVEVTFFSSCFQDFFRKLSIDHNKSDWMKCLSNTKMFVVFNASLLVTLGLDMAYWWRTLGIGNYVLYSLRSLQFYQNGVNIYLLVCLCTSLKVQLKLYSEKLSVLMEKSEKVISNSFSPKQSLPEDLFELRRVQCVLLDFVPLYNQVFGRNILLIIFNCIVNTILYTSIALVCLINKTDFQGIYPDIWFYLLCLFWILESLAFPIMLARACESVVTEAGEILKKSIDYLNEIPALPQSQELQLVKEELQMICQQAGAKRPVFSAAGFFVVDYTMLGIMVGSVTSYIIVVLQFVK